jgi:hypothetical protein
MTIWIAAILVTTVFITCLINLVLAFRLRKVEDSLRETKTNMEWLESHYAAYIEKNNYQVNSIQEELKRREPR